VRVYVRRSENAAIILEGLLGTVLANGTKPDDLVRVQQAAIDRLSVMLTGKRPAAAGDLGGASRKRAKHAGPVLLGLKLVLEGSHEVLRNLRPWNPLQEVALTEIVHAVHDGLFQHIQK
jgi:hypothetical protein